MSLSAFYYLKRNGEIIMEEIWKDIKDFEGIYQVSSLGNVRNKKKQKNIYIRIAIM